MTKWNTERMRQHVPDEELHPYLDQALSRSQCVEIETHLAQCAHCRDRRDTIAALRDRTTALLGILTPRNLIIPPPFETLTERLKQRPIPPLWQIRLKRAGLWAAGVIAAIGTGWAGRSLLDPHEAQPPAQLQQDLATFVPVESLQVEAPEPVQAETPIFTPAPGPAPRSAVRPRLADTRSATVRTASLVSETFEFPRVGSLSPSRDREIPAMTEPETAPFGPLWKQVQWEDALKKAGPGLPYIEGLLVVGVLLREGAPGERPTAMVAQQDASGEVILSIEGPATTVDQMIRDQASPEVHSSEVTRTTPDYVSLTGGGTRRVNRVLAVTGRMSVDSLNALARMATIR
jgi:hypothetical protein